MILGILLTGCETAISSVNNCPPVPAYTKEFQQKVADDLGSCLEDGSIRKDSPIFTLLEDCRITRNQVKICRGEN